MWLGDILNVLFYFIFLLLDTKLIISSILVGQCFPCKRLPWFDWAPNPSIRLFTIQMEIRAEGLGLAFQPCPWNLFACLSSMPPPSLMVPVKLGISQLSAAFGLGPFLTHHLVYVPAHAVNSGLWIFAHALLGCVCLGNNLAACLVQVLSKRKRKKKREPC